MEARWTRTVGSRSGAFGRWQFPKHSLLLFFANVRLELRGFRQLFFRVTSSSCFQIVLFAGALLVVSSGAWAQDTAQIVGTVTDTTGAVIPNAKVTVSNRDKGYTRELVSNSAGAYSGSALPIGNYVVTAQAQGFEKLVRSGIALQVGQIQRVDLQMTLGQVTQEITVTGNIPKVQTESSAISDVVTGTQIEKLELNGRNFVTLATLVPGAVPDNGLNTSTVGVYGNNNISFNGNRMQYNNWEIDGGNNTDEGSTRCR